MRLEKFIYLLLSISIFGACKNAEKPKEDIDIKAAAPVETTPGIAAIYKIDLNKSNLNWSGASVAGKHNGTVKISSGRINVVDGNITSGDIDIDLKSIIVSDLKDEKKLELETHLKDVDFFETEKFSIARFVLTKAEKLQGNPNATHQITGELTIKDISNTVSFPAVIILNENSISAKSASFAINRTKWKITYQSSLLGIPLDKAIKDDILLQVKIEANKK